MVKKNVELQLNQYVGIRSLFEEFIDRKNKHFSYILERNISKINVLVRRADRQLHETVTKSPKEVKAYEEYAKAYGEVENEHASKTRDRKPKLDKEGRIIPKDAAKYKDAIKALRTSHKEGYQAYLNKQAAISDLGLQVFKAEFLLLSSEDQLPDDLSAQDRMKLRFIMANSLIPEEEFEDDAEEGADA